MRVGVVNSFHDNSLAVEIRGQWVASINPLIKKKREELYMLEVPNPPYTQKQNSGQSGVV